MALEAVNRSDAGRDTFSVIDRQVPIPYYYQLENYLRDEISRGRWRPGDRVLSEEQLCKAFSVSRTTVRQAVGRLVTQGVLYHSKGRGTFVAGT